MVLQGILTPSNFAGLLEQREESQGLIYQPSTPSSIGGQSSGSSDTEEEPLDLSEVETQTPRASTLLWKWETPASMSTPTSPSVSRERSTLRTPGDSIISSGPQLCTLTSSGLIPLSTRGEFSMNIIENLQYNCGNLSPPQLCRRVNRSPIGNIDESDELVQSLMQLHSWG